MENKGLIGWERLRVEMTVKTGLHIGGSKNTFEIGAIDNQVIKDANNTPFIPGSSLKGKLRSLLERKYAINEIGNKVLSYEKNEMIELKKKLEAGAIEDLNEKDLIILAFGNGKTTTENLEPLLIFRDLYPKDKEFKLEIKTENSIDRIRATASNPRDTERIAKGSKFEGEIVIRKNGWGILDENSINKLVERVQNLLQEAVRDLNKYEYLGGSGTRGYGAVEIKLIPERTN